MKTLRSYKHSQSQTQEMMIEDKLTGHTAESPGGAVQKIFVKGVNIFVRVFYMVHSLPVCPRLSDRPRSLECLNIPRRR